MNEQLSNFAYELLERLPDLLENVGPKGDRWILQTKDKKYEVHIYLFNKVPVMDVYQPVGGVSAVSEDMGLTCRMLTMMLNP